MPKASADQIEAALPEWQRFLRPMLTTQRGACREIGLMRVQIREPSIAGAENKAEIAASHIKAGNKQGEIYLRWLRKRSAPYPVAQTLWEFAQAASRSKYPWAAGPLVLYAAGRLQEFVQVVGTVNTRKLGPDRLIAMLENLQMAVDGDAKARGLWVLKFTERDAFLAPHEAKGVFRKERQRLAVAHAISQHYEVEYRLQRQLVLRYLMEWLQRAPG